MKNKIIIHTILFAVIIIFSFSVLSKNKGNSEPESQIILFYGIGCPHCAIVEKYIEENKVKEEISFAEKEVYYNQSNAKELEEKAKICKISENEVGVPFLWDGKKCYIGDVDIVNFFKEKINEK